MHKLPHCTPHFCIFSDCDRAVERHTLIVLLKTAAAFPSLSFISCSVQSPFASKQCPRYRKLHSPYPFDVLSFDLHWIHCCIAPSLTPYLSSQGDSEAVPYLKSYPSVERVTRTVGFADRASHPVDRPRPFLHVLS